MPRYIDADAFKERLLNHPSDFYDVDELLPMLDDQPTISPDEVRGVGEWIKNNDGVCWWWECSECHEQPLQRYKYDRLSSFCPSCGARMKGAEDAT